jgi:hypothetical protein
MKIQEAPLPPELKECLPNLLTQVTEYLELEEAGFSVKDIRFNSFYTVDDSAAFVIFDYTSDDGPSFAFVQYDGSESSPCIGCWPRTEGETLAWSIAEYLEMNPIDNE